MKLSEGKTRYVSRIVVVLLGASAIVLAYAPKNMIAVIMTASLGLVAVFVVPYTFGLFWKRFNTPGAVSGMIVGLVVLIWLTYIPVLGGGAGPQGFSLLKFQPLFWTILIQLVVSVIVTVLTPEPRKEIIERHFKKTDGSTC
jgi:Na+/proline symporter